MIRNCEPDVERFYNDSRAQLLRLCSFVVACDNRYRSVDRRQSYYRACTTKLNYGRPIPGPNGLLALNGFALYRRVFGSIDAYR